jgi:DHA2 family methylenomycin A resistance protein-like MFS transporter
MSSPETDRPIAERGVLVTAALGTMLAPLNSTMIVVALPEILDEFDRSLAWGSWIVVSYLVAMAAGQPLGGSLGDRYGRRRLFLIGLLGFLGASLAAALAPSLEMLIAARTVQAIAGALAIPNGTAMVRTLVAPERQGAAFGRIGAGIAVAAAVGPPLGGVLTDALGWRWIFAVNVLLIAPALLLGLRLPAGRGVARAGRFDLLGALLMTVALVSLALSLTVWRLEGVPIALAPALGLIAAGSGAWFVRHARGHPRPVLQLDLFRRPGFTPASLTVLLSNLTMYTLLLSLPVYLAEREEWGNSQIGLLLAAMSLQMVVFSPLGGRLSDRRGRRLPAALGTLLIAAGTLPFLLIGDGWGWPKYLLPLTVVGAGVGLSSAPVQAAAVEAAPREATGQASGLFSTMRYLGSILGSAGMAAILSGDPPAVVDFRLLYAVLVAAALLAWLAASRLPDASSARRASIQAGRRRPRPTV